MRRIKLFLLVTAALASLLAMNAGPALADDDGCIGPRWDNGRCIGVETDDGGDSWRHGWDRGDRWDNWNHWNRWDNRDNGWNFWNADSEEEDCFWWYGYLVCEDDF